MTDEWTPHIFDLDAPPDGRADDAELSAIDSRANAATPGPWVSCVGIDDEGLVFVDFGEQCKGWSRRLYFGDMEQAEPDDAHNCDFIAAARADIPRLLELVRAERAALAHAVATDAKHCYEARERIDLERDKRQAAEAERDGLRAELLSLTKYKAVSMNESDGPYALQYPGNDPVCVYDPDHDPFEAYELFADWLAERAGKALAAYAKPGMTEGD